MKIKYFIYMLTLSIFLISLLASCKNTDINNDFQQKIVGKWKLIEQGWTNNDMRVINNGDTIEFTSNGKIGTSYTYRIDSNFLYKDIITTEPHEGGQWVYKYNFYEDKIRLEIINGIVMDFHIFIYKKIKS